MAPVGPQPLLGAVGEPGAAHDQPTRCPPPSAAGGVGRVGDLGLSAFGVGDVDPGVLVDRGDRGGDRLHAAAHGHRVAHVEPVQGGDGVVGPEPGIDAHGQRAGGAGAADAGDQLVEEAACAALGVGLASAHPGVQHLAGVGAGGEDRVVAEHLGVTGTLHLALPCRRRGRAIPDTCWYGPRDVTPAQRTARLRWLAPILVNVDERSLDVTVRPVHAKNAGLGRSALSQGSGSFNVTAPVNVGASAAVQPIDRT